MVSASNAMFALLNGKATILSKIGLCKGGGNGLRMLILLCRPSTFLGLEIKLSTGYSGPRGFRGVGRAVSGRFNIASVAGENDIKLMLDTFLWCRNVVECSVASGEPICERDDCRSMCWNGKVVTTWRRGGIGPVLAFESRG